MEKIVILTDHSEDDNNLIKCLNMLFPECEIEIHTSQAEVDCNSTSTSGSAENKILDDKLEKLLSFL